MPFTRKHQVKPDPNILVMYVKVHSPGGNYSNPIPLATRHLGEDTLELIRNPTLPGDSPRGSECCRTYMPPGRNPPRETTIQIPDPRIECERTVVAQSSRGVVA